MNLTFKLNPWLNIQPWLQRVINECGLYDLKVAPYKGFNKFFLDDCSDFCGHYGGDTFTFIIESEQDSLCLYYEPSYDGVLQEFFEKSVDFFLEDKQVKPYKGFTVKPYVYMVGRLHYHINYEGTRVEDADGYCCYFRDSKLSLQEHFEQEVNQYIGLQ